MGGGEKRTLRNSLSRTVNFQELSFRLPQRRVSPEEGRYALGRTSGRVDNGSYRCGADRSQIGQPDGGGIPRLRGLTIPQTNKSLPHYLPRLEVALRTSRCQDPSPRPPCAPHRALSLQRLAISLLKAQGPRTDICFLFRVRWGGAE